MNEDWASEIPSPEDGTLRIRMLIPDAGVEFYEPGDLTQTELHGVAEERARAFRKDASAERVWVRPIDPSVGASGPGLGVVFDFVGVGADVIAWAGAAVFLARALRKAQRRAERELSAQHSSSLVSWSAEALQVIAVADLLERESLDAVRVRSLEHFSMKTQVGESRRELDEIFSIHAIGIEIDEEDPDPSVLGGTAWFYLVYSDGSIAERRTLRLPHPKGPLPSELTAGMPRLLPIAGGS